MKQNLGIIFLIIFSLVIIILTIIYIVSIFFNFFTDNAPYVGSFNYQLKLMKEKLHLKSNKNIVDLGCGDGKALRFFSKNYNFQKLDGYEIKYIAYFWGKIINLFVNNKKISIFCKNFLDIDLKIYDYIYIFLLPKQLVAIENWIFQNMQNDAIIISNSFKFIKHKPFEIIKNKKGKDWIFLYKK